MLQISKLTTKFQTTVPTHVRKLLQLKAGDMVGFEINGQEVRLRRATRLERAPSERSCQTKPRCCDAETLAGPPRITHIWGFQSVDERNLLRREHYAAGLWPPQGGPERIAHATSTIAISAPGPMLR